MRIVVGVSGGVAAYKAATLVSTLVQRGHQVQVLLTPGATQFIAPLTFAALWAPGSDGIEIMRVSLCELGVIGGARLNESFRLGPNPMCHEGSFKIEQSRLKVWVNAEAHGPMLDLPPPGAVSNSAVTP